MLPAVRPAGGNEIRRGASWWRQAVAWSLGAVGAATILWHVSGSSRSELADDHLRFEDTGFRVTGVQRDRLNKALEDLHLVGPARALFVP